MKLGRLNQLGIAPAVIASGARQSSAVVGQSGLLRCARNDESGNVGAGMTE